MGQAVVAVSIRLQTSKTFCHPQPVMRAEELSKGPNCPSAIITAAGDGRLIFFYYNWDFFFPSLPSVNNASEEHDLFF